MEQGKITINGSEVVAVKKDSGYVINQFKLDNGATMEYKQVLHEIRLGHTTGLIAQPGNAGQTIIRSSPSENIANLDELPTY